MKKTLILACAGLMMLASSCSQFKKYAESRAILEDEARVFVKPMVAELETEQTRRTWTVNLTKKQVLLYGNNQNLCRYACDIAVHNGSEDGNPAFDAIVAPTYVIKPSKRMTIVEITGYPAKFKSIKTLTEDDEQTLKFGLDPFYDSVVIPADNGGTGFPVIFGKRK